MTSHPVRSEACEAFRPVTQRNRKCCLSTPEVLCLVAGEDSILRSSAFRYVTDTVIFTLYGDTYWNCLSRER